MADLIERLVLGYTERPRIDRTPWRVYLQPLLPTECLKRWLEARGENLGRKWKPAKNDPPYLAQFRPMTIEEYDLKYGPPDE